MAGQTLSIQLSKKDMARLNTLIDRVEAGVSTLSPFFDAVEAHMIDSLTTNFEEEGRPIPWEPLAEATIEEKGSSAILQDTGALKQSINAQNTERDNLSLRLWAGDEKAPFHQLVDVDPLSQWGMVNEIGMPFRPFILFQDDDIDDIENILNRYMDALGL